MSRHLSHHARFARLLLCAAIGATSLSALPGCGDQDSSDSIKQARIDLETLASSRGAPVSTKGRQVSYEQVVRSLDKAAGSSRAGQAAAAKQLRSRAKVRMADMKAAEAAEIERRTLDRIVSIRAAHDRWLSLNAGAVALEAFDPKPALSELDKQIADKDADINAGMADKAKSEGLIADLTSKATAAIAKGKAEHDEEARIRQSAVEKSETERAGLIKTAAERRRAGDGFDKQAADLGAEIAKEQPNLAAITRRIERLQQQRKLLDDGKKQINDSVVVNKQQADKAREAAAEVAADLVKWATELKTMRAGLNGPSDDAERLYSEAFNEASKAAAGQQRASVALATASCKHALADALLVRARGLEAYAGLLEMLAQAQPAIPGADFGPDAATARKDATDTLAKAREAFNEAEGMYSAAGGSTEVKGRVEYIARTLHLIATGKEAPREAAPAPETPEPKDGAAAAPEAPPGAPSAGAEAEIRAMITKLSADAAAGKAEDVVAHLTTGNDADRPSLQKVGDLIKAQAEFNATCVSAFGSDFATLVKQSGPQNPMLAQLGGASPVGGLAGASDLNIKVTSDTEAEVSAPNSPGPGQRMVKGDDGQWRCVIPPEGLGMLDKLSGPIQELFTTMSANIKAGKYDEPAKMLQDLQVQAIAVFAKLQQPPK